ncbi:SpoIIE family protein phosphatase [Methanobrevibacter curvatus]|uniref:Phosphoserine phosphatase RsbU n=1 Tax=Methanobrevibacter curvatus TaxID=49547 RepID=A0A165Z6H7_9EURY|nr:PP2C family protein-serine/threonine phosphatase [Methanobrevibacter curvatus]KZX10306.1 phosphoserine phosphatase RsbU [Methanobrevibacter curvatus]
MVFQIKNSNENKRKMTVFIICSLLFIVVAVPFRYFFPIFTISEMRPASALPPVFGMMFGFWGALGAAFGNLISDIIAGYPLSILIVGFLAQFLFGYIAYKLWYGISLNGKFTFPRLDSVNNLLKFIIVIIITSVTMTWLICFIIGSLGFSDFSSLTSLILLFNNFNFSMIIGAIIISIANVFGIKMHKPIKPKKMYLSGKIFDLSIIISTIIGLVYTFYSFFYNQNYYIFNVGVIFYLLIIFYVFKPIEIDIINKKTKVTLTELFILVFINLGAVVAVSNGIEDFYSFQHITNLVSFWLKIYNDMAINIVIFYIFSIVILWYIEKNITTPIESMSEAAEDYIQSENKIMDSSSIISQINQFVDNSNECGILSRSLIRMIEYIKKYMKNLEKVTSERERINTELNIAAKIQEAALPKEFLRTDDFEVYALFEPAKEVGGDFYDFFLIDDDHLAIVIGDVSGKGIPAALFMMVSKSLLKNEAKFGMKPNHIFNIVNNQLAVDNDENMFLTAWMGILELSTGKLEFTNAGHNPPLIKNNSQKYEFLKSRANFVLGPMENINYDNNELQLTKGDKILLYTDGISESINKDKEFFGEEKIANILNNSNLDIKESLIKIKNGVDNFAEGLEQFDDITMLILKYK